MAERPIPAALQASQRFFGWRIAILAALTGALTGPGQTIGVAVFVDSFIEDLALTRSEVSAAYLVGTLLGALALPRVGGWIDRVGVRSSMTVIGIGFGAALVAMSGVGSLVALAAGFTFIRLLGQGSLSLVSSVAVTHWFDRRRGLVLGLVATVTGVLMGFAPIGLNALIGAFSWRTAWILAGIIIWVTVVPIARFGMINRPSDVGQLPDGRIPEPGDEPEATAVAGLSRREAMRTKAFWVLVAATAAQAMLITALNFHQIAVLGEAGFTAAEAALLFLPQVVGAAIGGIAFGIASDRWRGGPIIAVEMGILGFVLWLVGGVDNLPSVVLYAVLLGLVGGGGRAVTSALLPRWFGTAHIGAIAGVVTLVMVAASALGPLALSVVGDATSGYASGAIVFVIIPLAVLVAALMLREPDRAGFRQPAVHDR